MTPELFAQYRSSLTGRLVTLLTTIFRGFDDWRSPRDAEFAARAVPIVQGAQRTLGNLTALWIADNASRVTDVPAAPPSLPDRVLIDLRPGVSPEQVYQRPFTTVRWKLSEGKPWRDAVAYGEHRLREIADGDLQRTHAEAARATLRSLPQEGLSGWRRELVGTENCGLCVIAATQLYRTEDLNPLHHGCNCVVRPVYGDDNRETDEARVAQLHAAVEALTGQPGGLSRRGYRDLLISMTPEHGELGPMLVRPRDHFTGPADLAS